MKKKGLFVACALALALAASAEESSKSASGGDGIELGDLVARVAKRINKPFVIDPRVRTQVSLVGVEASQVTYDQLLAILDVHQIAVTESGGILEVVPDANARQFPTPVYSDTSFTARDGDIVTLVLSPKSVCSPWLVPILRPLMPQAAHMAADLQTNSLIINDRAANVRRIASLVEQLDKKGKGVKECPAPASPTAPAKPST